MVIGPIRSGWQEHAACGREDPALFFPETKRAEKQAKAICSACPVRTDCLNAALARGEQDGIWGGLGFTDRQRALKDAS